MKGTRFGVVLAIRWHCIMLPRLSASQCRLQQRAGADGTNNRSLYVIKVGPVHNAK